MRKSAILQRHFHELRASLFLLLLFSALAAGSPATAQKEKTPQLAIHTAYDKSKAEVVKKESTEVTIPIRVTPNPTTGSFRARMYGSREERVRVEILDQQGRVIDARNVSGQAELRFGYWYQPGTYFIHFVQGTKRKKVKLVKLAE